MCLPREFSLAIVEVLYTLQFWAMQKHPWLLLCVQGGRRGELLTCARRSLCSRPCRQNSNITFFLQDSSCSGPELQHQMCCHRNNLKGEGIVSKLSFLWKMFESLSLLSLFLSLCVHSREQGTILLLFPTSAIGLKFSIQGWKLKNILLWAWLTYLRDIFY